MTSCCTAVLSTPMTKELGIKVKTKDLSQNACPTASVWLFWGPGPDWRFALVGFAPWKRTRPGTSKPCGAAWSKSPGAQDQPGPTWRPSAELGSAQGAHALCANRGSSLALPAHVLLLSSHAANKSIIRPGMNPGLGCCTRGAAGQTSAGSRIQAGALGALIAKHR